MIFFGGNVVFSFLFLESEILVSNLYVPLCKDVTLLEPCNLQINVFVLDELIVSPELHSERDYVTTVRIRMCM